MTIRPATTADADIITDIYNYFILNTIITFEETPLNVETMAGRINAIQSEYPYLVIEQDEVVQGYAYATRWRERAAYRASVETTIYLHPDAGGKGLGGALYSELIQQLREAKFKTALGGIALPNEASVALHEKLGFNKVAHFIEVGYKFERWLDVGWWQLML